MGGEPNLALDLVDTELLAVDPPVDLLTEGAQAWWGLQEPRLPAGPVPDLAATRRLRAALREVFTAAIEHRRPEAAALEDLNAIATSVPTSIRLERDGTGSWRSERRWHAEHGGNARLAAIAEDAISVLANSERAERLRRCASPTCSMLFVAENARRQWCAANICGNRARVARHYERTHRSAEA